MMGWNDFDYGAEDDPSYRRSVVDRGLARLQKTPPESPELAQRKAKDRAERLRRHDERWGLEKWGDALTAGDQEGDADVS